jgi:DNA-binding NtrC family response regulator
MKFNILIVDDEKGFAESLKEAIGAPERNIQIALCAKDAARILSSDVIHLVLLDEKLPDMSGIDLLESITNNYKDIISIVITATKSIPLVVKSIQLGAYQYIVKPFKIEELENIVKNALEKVELKTKVKNLEEGSSTIDKPVFIGSSAKIEAIKHQIDTLKGHAFSSILITGETGTGKGSLAKYIHWQCFKDMDSFVHISCADIPANLLETELFGYAKGAFTDAKETKKGLFELANGGTLFLDEIDSFPIDLQKKLLNFLDNKKIRRTEVQERFILQT